MKYLPLPSVLLFLVFSISCTDVELCPESPEDHPHNAIVTYSFDWGSQSRQRPDSMYVLAYRVINQWKSSVKISAEENPASGHFLWPLPDSLSAPGQPDTTRFSLKSGDYKFITFNVDESELDYSHVTRYIRDDNIHLQDLHVTYKTYAKGDSALRYTLKDWIDYNVYGESNRYMQPSVGAIFYDTISVRSLRANGQYHINFARPRPLTQQVKVLFDVRKEISGVPFTVDSIFAEISGIPPTINLSTGYIDITHTKKIMFKTQFQKDTESNTLVHCSADIDVPSIVQSSSDDLVMGPGIMQVMIFCSTVDPQNPTGEKLSKKFQGIINLYHTLKEANLLAYTPDRQHALRSKESGTLNIKAVLVIDGEKILESPDNEAGLDRWIREDKNPIIVDI